LSSANYKDSRKLVFKRYRGKGLEAETEAIREAEKKAMVGPMVTDEIYFRDANMQRRASQLAEKFTEATQRSPVVLFIPVAVIKAHERPGEPLYATECFLTGRYQKWNSNGFS
jgi:hypothetical protein